MALLRGRRCACGKEYEVLVHRGVTLGIDTDEPVCPACGGGEFIQVVTSGTGIELGGGASTGKLYPYFDRGLGCHVESAADRRRICKERGLIPVDGDIDLKPSDREREFDRLEQEYDRYTDRLENDPQFADYRRLRDMGHPDFK